MAESASIKEEEHSFFAEDRYRCEANSTNNIREWSKDSSNPEKDFDKLNKEIKFVTENRKDLSYNSNSNSKTNDQIIFNDQYLDSKYWAINKEYNHIEKDENLNNENDEIREANKPKKTKTIIKFFLEENKIPKPFHSKYSNYNPDKGESDNGDNKSTKSDEENGTVISNIEDDSDSVVNNNENEKVEQEKNIGQNYEEDNYDLENMEEKGINIKNENDIHKVNTLNVNSNNLNNSKEFLNKLNFNAKNKKSEYCLGSSGSIEDYCLFSNDQLNMIQVPNKTNNLFYPSFYRPTHFNSFVTTCGAYPSIFNKGNYPSAGYWNNKPKKSEEKSSGEKEENCQDKKVKKNLDKASKYSPFYSSDFYYSAQNINSIEKVELPIIKTNGTNTINSLNTINNMNNINYIYPKMNLNMAYYTPLQPQNILSKNQKMVTNINNKISTNKNMIQQSSSNSNLTKKEGNIKIKNNNQSEGRKTSSPGNSVNNSFNTQGYKNSSNYIKGEKISAKGEKQMLNLDDIVTGKDTRTTVMIRNIPIKYTDDILIEALEEFKGKYDCLYMPYDYEKNGNKGYAFINFVNPLHILYFHEKFNGKKWLHFESSKICELNCAHFQGINEIQKHAKNYKGPKKPTYHSGTDNNNKMIIPSKYLAKLKKRFPKMNYTENKLKKVLVIKSFE